MRWHWRSEFIILEYISKLEKDVTKRRWYINEFEVVDSVRWLYLPQYPLLKPNNASHRTIILLFITLYILPFFSLHHFPQSSFVLLPEHASLMSSCENLVFLLPMIHRTAFTKKDMHRRLDSSNLRTPTLSYPKS